MIPVSLQH